MKEEVRIKQNALLKKIYQTFGTEQLKDMVTSKWKKIERQMKIEARMK